MARRIKLTLPKKNNYYMRQREIGVADKFNNTTIGKDFDGFHYYWYVMHKGKKRIFNYKSSAINYFKKLRKYKPYKYR